MTVVKTYGTYAILTTALIMVLSVLSCVSPGWITTPTTPDPTVVKTATTPDNSTTATVTALEALHVRAEPMGLRLGYLRHGASVTLTGACRDGWAQIEWRGGRAWVKASFLSENKCSEEE